jgi:hypothetical protein
MIKILGREERLIIFLKLKLKKGKSMLSWLGVFANKREKYMCKEINLLNFF